MYNEAHALEKFNRSVASSPARYPTISAASQISPAPVNVLTSTLSERANMVSLPFDHAAPILVCKSTLLPIFSASFFTASFISLALYPFVGKRELKPVATARELH